MYVCGPTVQSEPHIGHLRSAIAFDILRRYLIASGYSVQFVRNVTDIDDKILAVAAETGEPWWQVADRNHRAFTAAYDAVAVLPPSVEPRATGHVTEMVDLMQRLIAAQSAYVSGSDVYFSVAADSNYGALSGQKVDQMASTDPGEHKRSALDFALWKGAKPGEPTWATPWGLGRPGWHLECSAMATRYLGPEFDIHGGGLDLIFPHHENELAQSQQAGDPFARIWMHHGLVNVGAEKMSKSLGNSLTVASLLGRVRPVVLRYFLGAPHYRSMMDWSEEALAEAATAYARIETFTRNARQALGDAAPPVGPPVVDGQVQVWTAEVAAQAWDEFTAAMDDDLAVPRALAALHGAVRAGNAALAGDRSDLGQIVAVVERMAGILGIDPSGQWPEAAGELEHVVDALVAVAVDARRQARERKDYGQADAIRDALADTGVVLEDTADGVRWRLAR